MIGQTTPSWMLLALPLMMIVTTLKALIGAARRPKGRFGLIGAAFVVIASLSSAIVLWSNDFILTLGGFGDHFGRPLILFLLGDLILHGVFWTVVAKLCVMIARRHPLDE